MSDIWKWVGGLLALLLVIGLGIFLLGSSNTPQVVEGNPQLMQQHQQLGQQNEGSIIGFERD